MRKEVIDLDYEAPDVLASYSDEELMEEAAVCQGYEIIIK